MLLIKQSIKAILIMICFMFLFYQGLVRADKQCKEANYNHADYRFCMGI